MVSRRSFLRGIAAVSALRCVQSPATGFDYVGCSNCIEVFRKDGGRKAKIQSVASQNPGFLKLGFNGTRLFALNEIRNFKGFATGSVEAYEVQPKSGRLTLINRQALALSATLPRHFAMPPAEDYLVVAVYGGGAYNVLPIHRGGEIGSVTQVIKEIGRSVDPVKQATAHPHSVVFHPSGKFVIGTDFGSDRLNVFSFDAGYLTPVQRLDVAPGSGPAELSLDEAGSGLVVQHKLWSMRSGYRFDNGSLSRSC